MRLNCARNSGVEHVSCPEGCDLKAEGLEPYHEHCMNCGCIKIIIFELSFLSQSSDSAAMSLFSCVPAFSFLQVGLVRRVLR